MKATMNVTQVAKLLNISPSTAYRAIKDETFPFKVIKVGRGRYVVPTQQVIEALGTEAVAVDGGDAA